MVTLLLAIFSAIIGFIASTVGSLSGGGGGNIVLPVIVSVIKAKPSVLVGSVFFMYLVSSITGLFAYNRKGLVDYRSGILLALPCIPGVILGTFFENYISDFEFKLGLGVLTATLALVMYRQNRRSTNELRSVPTLKQRTQLSTLEPHPDTKADTLNGIGASPQRILKDRSGRIFSYSPNIALGLLVNFLAALLSGTLGAGAGIIIIPATILLVKMPSHVAIATTRIVLLMLDLAAFVTHAGLGTFDPTYAVLLSIGSVIGSLVGAQIAFQIAPGLLTRIVCIVFAVLGMFLVLSTIF